MPEIPAEAVRAVAVILRAREVDQSGEGDIAPVAEFDADALELLIAAAPFLAEHIATLLVMTPKPADASWRAWVARVAREAFPQPSGTIQGASEGGPGISGCSDDPKAVEGLSALREELWQRRVAADVLGTLLREEEEASSRACTRAEHAEEALHAAQQTIARTVRYAIAQAAYRPVEAGSLAAVLLNVDPHDIDPDEAIRALETQGASLDGEEA